MHYNEITRFENNRKDALLLPLRDPLSIARKDALLMPLRDP